MLSSDRKFKFDFQAPVQTGSGQSGFRRQASVKSKDKDMELVDGFEDQSPAIEATALSTARVFYDGQTYKAELDQPAEPSVGIFQDIYSFETADGEWLNVDEDGQVYDENGDSKGIATFASLSKKHASSPPGWSAACEEMKAKGMPAHEAFGIAWKNYNKGIKPKSSSLKKRAFDANDLHDGDEIWMGLKKFYLKGTGGNYYDIVASDGSSIFTRSFASEDLQDMLDNGKIKIASDQHLQQVDSVETGGGKVDSEMQSPQTSFYTGSLKKRASQEDPKAEEVYVDSVGNEWKIMNVRRNAIHMISTNDREEIDIDWPTFWNEPFLLVEHGPPISPEKFGRKQAMDRPNETIDQRLVEGTTEVKDSSSFIESSLKRKAEFDANDLHDGDSVWLGDLKLKLRGYGDGYVFTEPGMGGPGHLGNPTIYSPEDLQDMIDDGKLKVASKQIQKKSDLDANDLGVGDIIWIDGHELFIDECDQDPDKYSLWDNTPGTDEVHPLSGGYGITDDQLQELIDSGRAKVANKKIQKKAEFQNGDRVYFDEGDGKQVKGTFISLKKDEVFGPQAIVSLSDTGETIDVDLDMLTKAANKKKSAYKMGDKVKLVDGRIGTIEALSEDGTSALVDTMDGTDYEEEALSNLQPV